MIKIDVKTHNSSKVDKKEYCVYESERERIKENKCYIGKKSILNAHPAYRFQFITTGVHACAASHKLCFSSLSHSLALSHSHTTYINTFSTNPSGME